jgi:hypothetical protein
LPAKRERGPTLGVAGQVSRSSPKRFELIVAEVKLSDHLVDSLHQEAAAARRLSELRIVCSNKIKLT